MRFDLNDMVLQCNVPADSAIALGVCQRFIGQQPSQFGPRKPIPDLAPDLSVEVLSEGNAKPEMARTAREYFEAGVILVRLIDPMKRAARVFSSAQKSVLVSTDQMFDGGDVLPGFVLPLSDPLDCGRQPGLG